MAIVREMTKTKTSWGASNAIGSLQRTRWSSHCISSATSLDLILMSCSSSTRSLSKLRAERALRKKYTNVQFARKRKKHFQQSKITWQMFMQQPSFIIASTVVKRSKGLRLWGHMRYSTQQEVYSCVCFQTAQLGQALWRWWSGMCARNISTKQFTARMDWECTKSLKVAQLTMSLSTTSNSHLLIFHLSRWLCSRQRASQLNLSLITVCFAKTAEVAMTKPPIVPFARKSTKQMSFSRTM